MMAPINIYQNNIDPATASPPLLKPSETHYVLVQYKAQVTQQHVVPLLRLSSSNKEIKIIDKIDARTLLCYIAAQDTSEIAKLGDVEQIYGYDYRFKVRPSLKTSTQNGASSANQLSVGIVLHRAGIKSLDDVVKELQGKFKSSSDLQIVKAGGKVVEAKVNPAILNEVAKLEAIEAITDIPSISFGNDYTRKTARVNAMNMNAMKIKPLGLTGSGQTVCVADTGIDYNHPALQPLARQVGSLTLDSVMDGNDHSGHGTHVAGTILGRRIGNIEGMAPNANLFWVCMSDRNDLQGAWSPAAADLSKVMVDPLVQKNAYIHNNSWWQQPEWLSMPNGRGGVQNTPFQREYGPSDALQVDRIAYDHPELIIVIISGNAGHYGKPLVGAHSVAKNVITVGSTISERPVLATLPPPVNGEQYGFAEKIDPAKAKPNPNFNAIAPNSSYGPSREGRIKPDIVAPGTTIVSARTSSIHAAKTLARCDQIWGVPEDSKNFVAMSGTSMAGPAVSGCAALLREALVTETPTKAPFAALVKALLLNGADNPNRAPDNHRGFGSLNVEAAVKPVRSTPPTFAQDVASTFTPTLTYNSVVPANAQALRATLTWTDTPGANLNTRLKLTVSASGRTATGPPNDTDPNNVVQLYLTNLRPGDQVLLKVENIFCWDKTPFGLVWDF